jgi:hypothetical protein
VPHSNFSDVLEIGHGGRLLHVEGPIVVDEDDTDLVTLAVSAFVTQQPAEMAPGPALGVTCSGHFDLAGDSEALAEADRWSFDAQALGGTFSEGWAFASAEMLQQSDDGGLEKYTWSQWVWLRLA